VANSVLKDRQGPDWPLGYINVPTPGTPVNIMSVVDPSNLNDPDTPTPGTPGADEYTVRCNVIAVQGYKFVGPGWALNSGNIYVVRAPNSGGSGGINDSGVLVWVVAPGSYAQIPVSALVRNANNPYRYFIDADTAGDGANVVLWIF
jgi:hypothetical protein